MALEEDVSYYSVQDNLSYEAVTRITSSWDKQQNIEMTFVNTGYEVIHNWYFLYNSPYEIINIWNSEIVESDSNLTYIISNCSYNQNNPVAGSVTIDEEWEEYIEFCKYLGWPYFDIESETMVYPEDLEDIDVNTISEETAESEDTTTPDDTHRRCTKIK